MNTEPRVVCVRSLLAMARHRLGETAEARKLLADAAKSLHALMESTSGKWSEDRSQWVDWTNAHITRASDGSYQVPAAIIESLLAEASQVLQGKPDLQPAWYGIGPKPIPGDGEPVLGRVDDVNGLYVAFTHSGATLGLIAGELLAYEIITGAAHPMLVEFNLRRFR